MPFRVQPCAGLTALSVSGFTLVDADMQVHIVRVLVKRVDSLTVGEVHFIKGNLHGLGHLLPCGVLVFSPAQQQVHDRIGATFVL
jgi:hypothetical protein